MRSSSAKIPRTLHYCWFGNESPSSLIQRCMESWSVKLPGFQLKRWDESNTPITGSYSEAAQAMGKWSRLSNFVRLHALHTEGGLYLDTDVEVVRDMTPLLGDPCFLGFQQREREADWVNAAVLGAGPGHPFLERCMERLNRSFEETGELARIPQIATAVLRDMGLKDYGFQKLQDVVLYPVEYFYPHSWLEDYSPREIGVNTYCVHHWVASWKPGGVLEAPRALRRLKRAATGWWRRTFGGEDH